MLDQTVESAPPVIQDATQMNSVLDMMHGMGQLHQVLQLFGAFTGAGVLPDLETYRIVTRACAQLGMFQCIEVLLRAAEQQGMPAEELLPHCLEAAATQTSGMAADPGFVLAWAPRAISKQVPVPANCCKLLLEDKAQTAGLGVAIKFYQELTLTGSDQAACATALRALVATAKDADCYTSELRRLLPEAVVERERGTPARVANPAPHVTPEKLSPPKESKPLPSPRSSAEEEWVEAEKTGDYDKAFRLYARQKTAHALERLFAVLSAVAKLAGNDPRQLLQEMQKHLGPLDVTAYNVVLAALASKGKFDQVERLVEEMRQAGVQPDAQTFNALLDSASRTGRYEKGWTLLSQMLKAGFAADKYPVSLLLKGVNDKGDKAKMKRGVELVEKYIDLQKNSVDDVLFNSLLDACCRTRDVPRLHRTLQKMRTYGVKPSAATFGTLLKAYGQQKDGDNVLKVWKEMHEAEVGVNPVTYGCMLDACVKCDFFELAEDVFSEMKKVGMHRNTILYTTVIKGCARQKKLKKALAIMQEMKHEGVLLNHVTYNSLIDTAIRCRDLLAATKLLEQMKEDKIQPDLITYSTLMKGFCDQGDLQVALNLYGKLKEQGMKPDEIMYNSLLEGCVKAGQVQTGLELFEEMRQNQVMPSNITFSILVKLYARMDRLDQALDVVQQMESIFKVKPTFVVFTALVKCCVASNRLQVAASLLLGLPRAAGVQPDAQMYAAVLPGLAAQGPLDLCLDVLEQYARTCGVSRQVYDQAQRVFQQAGRTGSFTVKEKARVLCAQLGQQRLLAPEHVEGLTSMLGPKGWQGAEFVPGQMWEGHCPESWTPSYAQTPVRKGRMADENASPNVMQMLLHDDGSSKCNRKSRRPVVSPGSGRKAPLVAKGAFTSQPLEYVAMSLGSPMGR